MRQIPPASTIALDFAAQALLAAGVGLGASIVLACLAMLLAA
jgi:hypothetical protein